MDKAKFEHYAELKQKVKELELEIAELAPDILLDIVESGADKVETDYGNFVVEKRKVWVYSSETNVIAETLKVRQKEEQADGTASYTESNTLKFLQKK